MNPRSKDVQLSVIVPVGGRQSDAQDLYDGYKVGLDILGCRYEMIFVLDGPHPQFEAGLECVLNNNEDVTIVSLSRQFGEATAIMAGFERASAAKILTLPAYHQIDASDIVKLVDTLNTADLGIAHRWPRAGNIFTRFRRNIYHSLVSRITKLRFRDLGCAARAMKRRVLEEIAPYGDQQRFLPILADRQGFKVTEVDVRQSPSDRQTRTYRPRDYTRQILDIFTVFFLVRFTKKPLRFFGMVGVSTFSVGAILILYLSIDRLVFGNSLADRPALLLSSLLVVLGLQLFALGLLGELIIFTHAKNIKDYQIDRVIEFPAGSEGSSKSEQRNLKAIVR